MIEQLVCCLMHLLENCHKNKKIFDLRQVILGEIINNCWQVFSHYCCRILLLVQFEIIKPLNHSSKKVWSVAVCKMIAGLGTGWQALLGTLFTWGVTAAGAALVFVIKGGQVMKKLE